LIRKELLCFKVKNLIKSIIAPNHKIAADNLAAASPFFNKT